MPQTLTRLLTHIIFSTKERRALIDPGSLPRLHAYVGGIARNLDATALAVGGLADHVHLLVTLPPTTCVADAVRVIKANSSKWMHEDRGRKLFAWQAGYAAFSVSQSNVDAVVRYIHGQEKHHRRLSFQDELRQHFKKHEVEFDEQFVWG